MSGRETASRPGVAQLGIIQGQPVVGMGGGRAERAQPKVETCSPSNAGQLHLSHTFFTRNVLWVSLESNFTQAHPS